MIIIISILIFFTAFLIFFSNLANGSSILINEVMVNPIEPDATHEWIELYNYGNKSINLSGWKITDNFATDYIAPANSSKSSTIPPYTFVIITDQDTELIIPEDDNIIHFMVDDKSIGNGLGNTNDYILLIDKNGTIVDTIKWGFNYSIIPEEPLPIPTKGNTFIRIRNTSSQNSILDFVETTTPTLGRLNIYTGPRSIKIQNAQQYLPKITKNEQFSIPFAINITLENLSRNTSFEIKTFITSVTSNPSSQTWTGEKWQYSDRYTHNVTTDESGYWQGWIYLRFAKNYQAYQKHIQHNETCNINVRIRHDDLILDTYTPAYLLDLDNSTSNGILGGYLIGKTKENHTLLLEDEYNNLQSCYVSQPNNVEDFDPVIDGYYKLSAPVGSNYTLYLINKSGNKKIIKSNISIVHGINNFDIKTKESSFDLDNRKPFATNITLENTGDLKDTYLLSIIDYSPGFNVTLKNNTITINPGEKQNITIFINPSSIRLYDLHYGLTTIKVISKNDPLIRKIYKFSCRIHEPDLTIPQIKSYDMNGLETNIIYQGHIVRVKAFFRNHGTIEACNATVSYFLNNVEPENLLETITYDNIDRYQKYPSLYLDTKHVPPGKHTIYVVADYYDTIKELDEYNNENSINLFILNTTPSFEEQQILITEFYYYTYPTIRNEFLTLYNPTNTTIRMDNWYITNTIDRQIRNQRKIIFPKNTYLQSFSYMTITQNATAYERQQMKYPDFEFSINSNPIIPQMKTTSTIFFSNNGGAISLKNEFNHTIDTILYGETTAKSFFWDGMPIPSVNQGYILKRREENNTYIDTNTAYDWIQPYRYRIGQSSFSPDSYYAQATITPFISPDTSFSVFQNFFTNSNREILFSVYEFTSPELTNILIDVLKQNITIKILVEGSPVGGMSMIQKYLLHQLHQHGAIIHILRGDQSEHVYKRYRFTHAKYAIIDGETVLIHSGNYGPTGIPSTSSFGNREWGIAITNSTVAEFYETVFYHDWNIKREDIFNYSSFPLFLDEEYNITEINYFSFYEPIINQSPIFSNITAKIQPVLSPDNSYSEITNLLLKANKSIYIQQLYIYSNWTTTENPIIPILIKKAEQGVDIRIILNYNPFYDSTNIHNNYTKKILESYGIKVQYFYTNWSIFRNIHNKAVVVDNTSVLISSINWNENSILNNREIGVIITHSEIAEFYSEIFFSDWNINIHEDSLEEIHEDNNEDEEDENNDFVFYDNSDTTSLSALNIEENDNTIYIVVLFTLTFALIASDWRKRKWR